MSGVRAFLPPAGGSARIRERIVRLLGAAGIGRSREAVRALRQTHRSVQRSALTRRPTPSNGVQLCWRRTHRKSARARTAVSAVYCLGEDTKRRPARSAVARICTSTSVLRDIEAMERHRKLPASVGHAAQSSGISQQFIKRTVTGDDHLFRRTGCVVNHGTARL